MNALHKLCVEYYHGVSMLIEQRRVTVSAVQRKKSIAHRCFNCNLYV